MIPGAQGPQPFSPKDATDLLTLAQSAPLANLHQAKVVDQMLLRAQLFFAAAFTPPKEAKPPVDGKKGRKNGVDAGGSLPPDPLA